ncbi:MAG TPA: Gfo/Idh/MocA family oxidoreductase [Polyangia bacterium]
MTRPTRRVALLGAGYIANYHARVLALIDGVQLTAVCDQSTARAQALAKAFGIAKTYASLPEMLAAETLDAVHVLVPPDRHFAACRDLLQAGVDVLVEKPMAVSAEECRQLVELAEQRQRRLGVGHNFLFAEPYERLRQDLAAGVLGPIDSLTVTWNKELGQLTGGPFDAWMLRQPRNVLIEVGPHLVAHVADLLPGLEMANLRVRASQPIDLPTGVRCYRRWQAQAEVGAATVDLRMSLGPGFTEHLLHVRGILAAATVDFERNTYILQRHAPLDMDFDRLAMTHAEAAQACWQSWSTVADYVMGKAKRSRRGGSPYAAGIRGAAAAFHTSAELDRRISGALGSEIIATCERLGEASGVRHAARAAGTDKTSDETSVKTSAKPSSNIKDGPSTLILGAGGFIGRELVRQHISAGRKVRLLVRSAGRLPGDLRVPGVEVVEGDLEKPDDLARALDGIERVCHLARANVKTWAEYQQHEIEMTRGIAEAALERRVSRFVYTGTIDSYFAGRAGERITEATPLDPQIEGRNLYARAKAVSEQLLTAMQRERGLPLVIVRPGIVIGRGGSPFHWGVGMWRHNSICQIWGQGCNPLPLVLVDDVARGLLAALDTPGIEGDSFNLVGPVGLTAHEYLDELDRAAGLKLHRIPTPILRFYAEDMFKWLVKIAVRFPERQRPTLRDWQSRIQLAQFDCAYATEKLTWRPESQRSAVVQRGIVEPVLELLATPPSEAS